MGKVRSEDPFNLSVLFGFMGLNILTFYWSLKGLVYYFLVKGNEKFCFEQNEKTIMLLQIIAGFVTSLPFGLLVLIVSLGSIIAYSKIIRLFLVVWLGPFVAC